MRIEEVIGRRMKDVRELNDMTQEQVGEQLGAMLGKPWSRQAVSLAEQGKRAFTAAELVAIASVVGTTVSRLFTPPMEAREIELPSGAKLERTELLETALDRVGVDKMVENMRETFRVLAQASIATYKNSDVVLDAVKTLSESLELVVQSVTIRADKDPSA